MKPLNKKNNERMANWEKLNKELDDALDSMTSEDWKLWASKGIKQTRRTMKHQLIKTEDYLLVVSDEEIKEGDYALLNKKTHLEIQKALPSCLKNAFKNAECWNVENTVHNSGHKKIIAHLPLNEAPYLDGVDVLPEITQEDDIEEAEKEFISVLDTETKQVYDKQLLDATEHGFIIGYNKAKETHKYTKEDMQRALLKMAQKCREEMGLSLPSYVNNISKNSDEIIQSLNQPKLPIAFECEIDAYYDLSGDSFDNSFPIKKPKTITTLRGTEWVGKYLFKQEEK